ncbi:MAG TPA: phage protease [Candidatus Competibacter sp.]|nr:phage protease [Candidatus Competibacter sp.]
MNELLDGVRPLAGEHGMPSASAFFRCFALDTQAESGARRAVSARIGLYALAAMPQPVTITRAGRFHDARYGDFEITPTMLSDMVRNFEQRTYGQDIFLDVAHRPQDGSAGKIIRLWVNGDRLLADVEWTPFGRRAVTERGYQYLSAEFADDYVDNERRDHHGPTLFGAALTIRPVIKRLDPIQLAEPTGIHGALAAQLIDEATRHMNKYLEQLIKLLAEAGLSKPVVDQLGEAFSAGAKAMGEDDAALAKLSAEIAGVGKKLAESIGDKPATINLTIQQPAKTEPGKTEKTLTEDDVRKLLLAERQRENEAAAASAKTLAERREQYAKLLNEAPSVAALPEATRAMLLAGVDLLDVGFSPQQVSQLAAQQIKLAEQMAVTAKLAGLGWAPSGSTRISSGEDQSPLKLQEQINQQLQNSLSFGNNKLRLKADKDLHPAVRRILSEFDRNNGAALHEEAKRLADGGSTTVGNLNVPAGFQRTVIREALSDLNVLALVQVLTDPLAQATTQIPYELRKTGTIANDGIVYESGGIPRASVEQKMDTAYVNKMALSMRISNEVAQFSRSSQIDWDAYARNVASNAQVMRELVARRIANELQRSADAYGATTNAAESVAAQLNGSNSLLKTTNWPIVRPKQYRDLQGGAIGSAINPIVVTINSTVRSEYDGTGTQAAGIYWVLENANLGFIRLVTEAGVPTGPANTGTNTVTYASANNVVKFDSKLPASTALEDHLNGALRAVGSRKAMLSADRYIMSDMLLMSPVLNDTLTNARQFAAEAARAGSALSVVGDLAAIKGIPAYGTNAPAIDLGDERIILGERGTLSYVVAKPFSTGTPFEAVNASGLPTGERIAYGEEYNAIHVPTPIQNRLTSVIVYDSDARTAAT